MKHHEAVSFKPDLSHTQPAGALVLNLMGEREICYPSILTATSLSKGAAVEEAEARKHRVNDPKCLDLGVHPT